ncbi:leucyl/phenylalanyl-tRNA--protein transferase [Propionibacteriaceae bacterium G1746]|uniref:leucyl/phenylalanyl-tRNA--protein transferase n=1 Tax=Aestuariimicrobium sp. G57 TaxID=3418485 RepID=UPI003C168EBF
MLHLFGPESEWPDQDLIAFSEEFDAQLAYLAYCSGVFPMPLLEGDHPDDMGWWSPVHRGVLPLDRFVASRSLRKSAKRFTTTVDVAFVEVVRRCAAPGRSGGWITPGIIEVYQQFHARGQAHSVEVWDADRRLVGGLYGVSVGGLFAGESMFHDAEHGRDASKVALVRLVDELGRGLSWTERRRDRLLDVQWLTPHLASLGAIEVPRREYLRQLNRVLTLDPPEFDRGEAFRRPGLVPTVGVADDDHDTMQGDADA